MVFIKPGAGRDPLRLKPENGLEATGVRFSGDRRQPSRETPRVRLPGSRVPPSSLEWIPARVHPPVIDRQTRIQIAFEIAQLILFVGILHLEIGRASCRERV